MSTNGTVVRKRSEPRERRMIVDYVRTKYPDATALFNERLGGIPEKLAGVMTAELSPNIAQPWARYVDAVVIQPKLLTLIEAKIPAKIAAVSQLLFYRSLLPKTPRLVPYLDRPIALEIVTAVPDPELLAYAESQGIRVEIYQPTYVMEYLAVLLKGRFTQ